MKYYESKPARALFAKYPWPETRPRGPAIMQTWFTAANAEMLERMIPPNPRCILELGSWYGGSALWLAEHYPDALIICVDIWKPYPEVSENPEWAELQPAAYSHFLKNLWEYRHRVVAVPDTTWWGMARVALAGLEPDAVYIDADHRERAVAADVTIAAHKFPKAVLIGDDWARPSVQRGVVRGCRVSGIPSGEIINNEICWAVPRNGVAIPGPAD